MSAKPQPTTAESHTNDAFETALDEARNVWSLDDVSGVDVLFPENLVDESTLAGTAAWLGSPSSYVLRTAVEQPDADEVDGAKPGDAARPPAKTYLLDDYLGVEDDADDDRPEFRVVATWTNAYGDERVTVESPAPWDTPDDMTPANEVVKSLPWSDGEAAETEGDLDEGAYYAFDDDDRAAPSEAAKAWSFAKAAAPALRELALEAGYAWTVEAGEDDEDDEADPDRFDHLLGAVEADDRVAVRYAKKNGNGVNTYEGRVVRVALGNYTHSGRTGHTKRERHRTGDDALVFEDEDGKMKKVKRDDDGVPSLYSSGYYPYMGEVLAVTLEPAA